MRNIILLSLLIMGCKGNGGSATLSNPGPKPEPTILCAVSFIPLCDYQGLGLYVDTISGDIWLKDYDVDYYYKIDGNGQIGHSIEMFFSDAGCTQVLGEVFNYPLHLSGDTYVFMFEDKYYEYPIPGSYGTLTAPFYSKVEGGPCTLEFQDIPNVREVTSSGFSL